MSLQESFGVARDALGEIIGGLREVNYVGLADRLESIYGRLDFLASLSDDVARAQMNNPDANAGFRQLVDATAGFVAGEAAGFLIGQIASRLQLSKVGPVGDAIEMAVAVRVGGVVEDVASWLSDQGITLVPADIDLRSFPGKHELHGTINDDTFISGSGSATINGLIGIDTVNYVDGPIDAKIAANGNVEVVKSQATDYLSNVEVIVGYGADDNFHVNQTLDITTGDRTFVGGGGNDAFYILGSSVRLEGGAGIDRIIVDTNEYSSSTIDLSEGRYTLDPYNSYGRHDTIAEIENVVGGRGDDFITGNEADNSISGGDGVDILVGNAGADTLLGGNGSDQLASDILHWDSSTVAGFRLENDGKVDVLDGGSGYDVYGVAGGISLATRSESDGMYTVAVDRSRMLEETDIIREAEFYNEIWSELSRTLETSGDSQHLASVIGRTSISVEASDFESLVSGRWSQGDGPAQSASGLRYATIDVDFDSDNIETKTLGRTEYDAYEINYDLILVFDQNNPNDLYVGHKVRETDRMFSGDFLIIDPSYGGGPPETFDPYSENHVPMFDEYTVENYYIDYKIENFQNGQFQITMNA